MKNCQKLSWKENRSFCSASGLQFKRQDSLCSALQHTSKFRRCNSMTLMSELATTVHEFPTPYLIGTRCYTPLTLRS